MCVRQETNPQNTYMITAWLSTLLSFYILGNDCMSRQQGNWSFDWTHGQVEDACDWMQRRQMDEQTVRCRHETFLSPIMQVSHSLLLSLSLSLSVFFFSFWLAIPARLSHCLSLPSIIVNSIMNEANIYVIHIPVSFPTHTHAHTCSDSP